MTRVPTQTKTGTSPIPSIDALLRRDEAAGLVAEHGHMATVEALRAVVGEAREGLRGEMSNGEAVDPALLLSRAADRLAARRAPALRAMFNLTGTVLHTNLGRALLSEAAVDHVAMAMREACNLEFDLDGRGRGDRDTLVEDLLCELTGAQAATVVNNNAAAVLLMLAALAEGREVVVSRGELVEIGGSFRIPDVMRAGHCRLVEVGTTNRTHARDYRGAIGPETAALMKVHTSNYRITGFTTAVDEEEVARIAREAGLPLLVDLGAGSLIDLSAYGLPREPVVAEVIAAGGDVVSFSGDKLLGGPQAGLIVGRSDLIERIRKHPLKRALRVSKMVLAALEATLLAYRRPDMLAQELPTMRMLTRPVEEIAAQAQRLADPLAQALGVPWRVEVVDAASQVGSGSLPGDVIASKALAAVPPLARSGGMLRDLAARLAALPMPVIGRIADNRLLLDPRCLSDEAGFVAQLPALATLMREGDHD